MDDVELARKSTDILEEYFSIQDLGEVVQCIEELRLEYRPKMLATWIKLVFDKKDKELGLLGIFSLASKQTITLRLARTASQGGLALVMDDLEDLTVDAPFAPRMLGEILGKLVGNGALSLREMGHLLKEGGRVEPGELIRSGSAEKVLVELQNTLKGYWGVHRSSGLILEDIMPEVETAKVHCLDALLEDSGLEGHYWLYACMFLVVQMKSVEKQPIASSAHDELVDILHAWLQEDEAAVSRSLALDEAELARKSTNILEEYFRPLGGCRMHQGAALGVPPKATWIKLVLDKKDKERGLLGSLLPRLVQCSPFALSKKDITRGLAVVIEDLEDLTIDDHLR
eukprot:SM000173S03036  [mRNA]  locus=s173:277930:280550:- [translate_table: standard]